MGSNPAVVDNVTQAVPFFHVTDIDASLRFYLDGLGGLLEYEWVADGRIRWCWVHIGEAALMVQEYWADAHPTGPPEGLLGQGVSICFMCRDALAIYRDLASRGIAASRPFVGNSLWVTFATDPDGYRLDFESETDVPGATVLGESPHTPTAV